MNSKGEKARRTRRTDLKLIATRGFGTGSCDEYVLLKCAGRYLRRYVDVLSKWER